MDSFDFDFEKLERERKEELLREVNRSEKLLKQEYITTYLLFAFAIVFIYKGSPMKFLIVAVVIFFNIRSSIRFKKTIKEMKVQLEKNIYT